MGWLYLAKPKAARLKDFLMEKVPGRNEEAVECAVVHFREGYMAVKNLQSGRITALVLLIDYTPNHPEVDVGFKKMPEESHPYYYNCPPKILELLSQPSPNGNASQWRRNCWENVNNKNKRRPKDGEIIMFLDPVTFGHGETRQLFQVIKKSSGKKKFLFRPVILTEGSYTPLQHNPFVIEGWTRKQYKILH